ncbi:MAG: hypothetical protein H6747_03830 [Deltaproteobacteria bacterium]|nr:hypothetical protein [Deltaproteobacteria bacterium]
MEQKIRIAAHLALMVAAPALMGALAQPRDRVELRGGGGAYRFVPACGSRAVQVRHVDAAVRLHNRHGPLAFVGGDVVTDLDGVMATETRKDAESFTDQGTGNTRLLDSDVTYAFARAIVGIDWAWAGLRLGGVGGGRFSRNELGVLDREFRAFPAWALRLGPEWIHARWSLGAGDWDTRPSAMTFALGWGIAEDVDDHEPRIRGVIGFTQDVFDNNAGYFLLGARTRVETFEIGLQGRAGPDGSAGTLYFGLPL